jgi:hypothetical protein
MSKKSFFGIFAHGIMPGCAFEFCDFYNLRIINGRMNNKIQ